MATDGAKDVPQDQHVPAPDQQAARALNNANAATRAKIDQEGENAYMLGTFAARYYRGLLDGGVGEGSAGFITGQYIAELVRLGEAEQQRKRLKGPGFDL